MVVYSGDRPQPSVTYTEAVYWKAVKGCWKLPPMYVRIISYTTLHHITLHHTELHHTTPHQTTLHSDHIRAVPTYTQTPHLTSCSKHDTCQVSDDAIICDTLTEFERDKVVSGPTPPHITWSHHHTLPLHQNTPHHTTSQHTTSSQNTTSQHTTSQHVTSSQNTTLQHPASHHNIPIPTQLTLYHTMVVTNLVDHHTQEVP